MFAAATSAASAFFKTSVISQNYILAQPASSSISSSSSSIPGRTSSPAPPSSNNPPFNAGLWRVQEAVHKTNGKRVSVWTFEARKNSALDRLAPPARERVIEVLKAEASALTRLRHPCVLEVAEPLEEIRGDLSFATELVSSTLGMAIPGSGPSTRNSEPLDEIEIQKGILQLSKGLTFLHTSARLAHSNLTPDIILINAAGDWKISGLGLTIPLLGPDGNPSKWEFPSYDVRIPPSTQRSFDYIAPEYAIHEQIVTASDMYSLGCVIYAVHAKGSPPFKNHNSLTSMRSNLGRLEGGGGLPNSAGWDRDLLSLLTALITPTPLARLSPETIATHSFFSSTAVSTLNFLDPGTFAPKPREEKIAFMKGLQTVLERFSEGMKRRKILPSILTEMKDPLLVPSILPNVFIISSTLDASQFQALVLPSLKPLFALKDPPQNMIVLLENLGELQKKTEKSVFSRDVLPLVYNALQSEHAAVQERALESVPDLCDTIDYAEVQGSLFPRVALVFTKTNILTVKVATLKCFLALVKTLDQTSLTQKLVPLLSKIKTKEPSVMLGTLAVHEAMGKKVDREAVALLVLPQLWQMSVGPLLNVDQFTRFMGVIRALTDRVEKEHAQHLRDAQRIEDRSALNANSSVTDLGFNNSTTDFAKLVGGGGAVNGVQSPGTVASATSATSSEDDIWGSILNSPAQTPSIAPGILPTAGFTPPITQSLPSSPMRTNVSLGAKSAGARTLGARTIPAVPSPSPLSRASSPQSSSASAPSYPFPQSSARSTSSAQIPTLSSPISFTPQASAKPGPPLAPGSSALSSPLMASPMVPLQPRQQPKTYFPPLQPQTTANGHSSPSYQAQTQSQQQSSGPNYNIVLDAASPFASSSSPPPLNPSMSSFGAAPPMSFSAAPAIMPSQPLTPSQPPAFFSSAPLQPTRNNNMPKNTGRGSADFSGFDPLL